ncbi:E set domain-containing protein [Cystobasidium minutum MCA 4210]|uniref:E set domain-containing protein n=1 Tax=Cystobasidium minutum MCA 4210 TaxID=1397322 RepID=UPI0034CF911D|eukprot:jgi/Rhomi1/185988/estExt_fgenesh1_pm.C_40264
MSHQQEGSSSSIDESDLLPTQTAGYRVGQQKTIDELQGLDKDDEALNRWKQSLLGNAAPGSAAGAKPVITLIALRLTSPGLKTPITLDLSSPESISKLKGKGDAAVIKEGAEYSVEIEFKVSGGLCSGLKYLQVAKRGGMKVDKIEQMIGSYGPNVEPVVKRFPPEEAPSGMLARGSYVARTRLIDDDGTIHADFEWSFKIAKDW